MFLGYFVKENKTECHAKIKYSTGYFVFVHILMTLSMMDTCLFGNNPHGRGKPRRSLELLPSCISKHSEVVFSTQTLTFS